MNLENKWVRGAIPALLIHCSIGTVYCWSTFKDTIAEYIKASPFSVGWAFSFAIFFLGMSAAFFGKIIERDVKKSAAVAMVCFVIGLMGTGFTIKFCSGTLAVVLLYVFYGCIMGIGLGVGYLTPVKTLMLWFSDNKGLATGISIMGFGLAKMIATPLMEFLQRNLGIWQMFLILGGIYAVTMFLGFVLIKKPSNWTEITQQDDNFKVLDFIKQPTFIGIWLMFYLNIHCGLMLITYEKQLLLNAVVASSLITLIPSLSAGFNALGRLGYATASDKMVSKFSIYQIIFFSSISVLSFATAHYPTVIPLIASIFIINAGYGGGFSTLPNLLQDKYGMKHISKIHGLALSAWAVAGLTGNNTTALILKFGHNNYCIVFIVAIILYFIAFITSLVSNK